MSEHRVGKIIAESRERESRRAATPIRQVSSLQTGSGALYGIIVPKMARSGAHCLDVTASVTEAVKLIFSSRYVHRKHLFGIPCV